MLYQCPDCLYSVDVPESAAGKRTTCPKCGKAGRIPEVIAAPIYVLPNVPPAKPPMSYEQGVGVIMLLLLIAAICAVSQCAVYSSIESIPSRVRYQLIRE